VFPDLSRETPPYRAEPRLLLAVPVPAARLHRPRRAQPQLGASTLARVLCAAESAAMVLGRLCWRPQHKRWSVKDPPTSLN